MRPTLVVALVLAAALIPARVGAGSASRGVDAGNVVLVDAVNTNRDLVEFDGTTAFRLRLPAGATCSGDSANDDYRVQTFLVPADTDLTTLRYRSRSPDGNDLYRALRYVDGELSTQVMTDQNPGSGQPALVLDYRLPFTFAHYRENSLPPGRWKIGVACTEPDWNVERFWDAEIILEQAPEVQPSGLRIRVVPSEPSLAAESSGGVPVLPVLIAVPALIGGIFVMVNRSIRRTP